ncbi:MAG: hypothetical protein O2895_01675 [Chloroflexi bacterium]|nr:hypothetical protein [Chloroflexota bacterium]
MGDSGLGVFENDAESFIAHTVNEDGRFFVAHAEERASTAGPKGPKYHVLVDRLRGTAIRFHWDLDMWAVPNGDGYGVVDLPGHGPWVLRFDGELVELVAPGRGGSYHPASQLFSPDGGATYFGGTGVLRVDLASGGSATLGDHQGRLEEIDDGFLMVGDRGGPEARVQRYTWADDLVEEWTIPAESLGDHAGGFATFSPASEWLVRSGRQFWDLETSSGIGGFEDWNAVVFADARTGTDLFRVHGASKCGGGWLADGTGLVVSTTVGMAILRPDELRLEFLADPVPLGEAALPEPSSIWYQEPQAHPSPSDPRLFLGEGYVFSTDGTVLAQVARGSWTSDGSEVYRSSVWHGAGDGCGGYYGPPTGGLAPRFEEAPFSDVIRLRPAVPGAALFAFPTAESAVLALVDDDVLLTVVNAEEPDEPPHWCIASELCSIAPSPDGQRIAYFEHAGGDRWLGVARADGSEARRLAEARPLHDAVPPVWSPDGATIYIERGPPPETDGIGGDTDILAVDATTGAVRVLVDSDGYDAGPRVSADGSTIVYMHAPAVGVAGLCCA